MWITNCFLLIMGTVAAVFGISFYLRNKEASGNIRFYILSYGISAGIWCFFFGLIGLCDDLNLCRLFRRAGDIGIIAFLITETFMITGISGARKDIASVFKFLSIITGVADYIVFSRDNVNKFVRMNGWTTWVADPNGVFNRAFHSGYILFTFFVLSSFGILWMKNNKVKRLRRFFHLVFIANFTMLFFTLPDTFLPAMGKAAVSTSGIGAAICTIVMWYGATQLGSFDIRVGNLRDKIFDFIEAGVIVLDSDKKIALMNRYSKKLTSSLGFDEKELDERGIEDFFDITVGDVEKIFRLSMDDVYTSRLWNRGKSRAYSVRLSAVRDSYGEVFCFLFVFVDVTEEVEAVSKFKIASRAKSRFLAQMSHEIRTPINAVLGMNEMILRESEDDDILEYAGNIESAGNILLSLINSILDFSKIEDGKMEIVPVKYDTASFINDLYHSIIQRADAKGLSFIIEADENLPCTLIGDDVRVSQVIMNLLTNAVKYTERGSVTLSLRALKKDGGKVKIAVSVADSGIGIKEDDRERLFESFERLDEVRNHNIEGTGLRISIVTSLLEMMGSRLRLDSTYGKGSVFSFELEQGIFDDTPIGSYETRLKESAVRKDKDDMISAPNARILVADDNDMNLKVARNLLKLCGIKPTQASSGAETIELMREHTYDIVFLDHMMPGMDGIETLHNLQKENLIPENTVMIALTANAVVGARENYLSEGFTDYLSKPIEIKHLVEKLKTYLPKEAYKKSEAKILDFAPAAKNGEILEFSPDNGEILEFSSGNDEISEFSSDNGEILEFFSGADSLNDRNKAVYDTEKLKKAGFNAKSGLKYCANDETLYFEMLGDFASSCDKRLEEADSFLLSENWNDYKIKIHAMKSNAKMIGAKSVYEIAKDLEEAAKRFDGAYIKDNHESLIRAAKEAAALIFNADAKPHQRSRG